ncbi:MAG: protein kinase, partial [Candidatus Symbiothrix sp.]|nr:protein kinase [Candidatus Symbiothrix sp.]
QDLSPENILINEQGDFLITDFGISTKARNTLRKSVINLQNTQDGGKVDFMGPERFGKNNDPVKASDIWALGVTMYELIEGRLPFPMGLGGLAQKGGADIPQITGDYSKKLKDTVYKCLAQHPWDRPTAEALVELTSGKDNKSNSVWKILSIAGALVVATIVAFFILFSEEKTVKNKPFDLHGKSFIYTGEVKEGLPDGQGSAKYEKSNTEEACLYEGQFFEGYREGKGFLQFDNSPENMDGVFHKDVLQSGIYKWEDGSYFKGEFTAEGCADGIWYDKDDSVIGTYINGEFYQRKNN